MSAGANAPATVGVVIAGAAGRMGRMLLSLAARDPRVRVVGALEAPGHPSLGADSGALVGAAANGVAIAERTAAPAGSVLVDFSGPGPALEHVREAAARGWAAVVGATGFSPEEERSLDALGDRLALLRAGNMSVGITALLDVVDSLARRLGPSFDVEISEIHHRLKKDAPSGTAIMLGRAAAAGRDTTLEAHAVHGREGQVGERPVGEIGVLALRGGDVVGDHTVFFLGTGERVEITHRAQSREAFAAGALRAAAWIAGRPPGRYSMRDVLGLG